MEKPCFFCDIQKQKDPNVFSETEHFFARFDDFPCTEGHCEIISKRHIVSFFDLSADEVVEFYEMMLKAQGYINKKFKPDAFTIGVNDGEAAGRTQNHLHIHLIPRRNGDVSNPKGGIRNIFPKKGDYTDKLKDIPGREKYL